MGKQGHGDLEDVCGGFRQQRFSDASNTKKKDLWRSFSTIFHFHCKNLALAYVHLTIKPMRLWKSKTGTDAAKDGTEGAKVTKKCENNNSLNRNERNHTSLNKMFPAVCFSCCS